jgi:hypothetical protein
VILLNHKHNHPDYHLLNLNNYSSNNYSSSSNNNNNNPYHQDHYLHNHNNNLTHNDILFLNHDHAHHKYDHSPLYAHLHLPFYDRTNPYSLSFPLFKVNRNHNHNLNSFHKAHQIPHHLLLLLLLSHHPFSLHFHLPPLHHPPLLHLYFHPLPLPLPLPHLALWVCRSADHHQTHHSRNRCFVTHFALPPYK